MKVSVIEVETEPVLEPDTVREALLVFDAVLVSMCVEENELDGDSESESDGDDEVVPLRSLEGVCEWVGVSD